MVAYSGEGEVRYYDIREARRRIHKGELFDWTNNMITKHENISYIDNGNHEQFEDDYFIAICLGYLLMRLVNRFMIEPYS